MRTRDRERQYCFDPTTGELTVEYEEERDSSDHGAACQCDECMKLEDEHPRIMEFLAAVDNCEWLRWFGPRPDEDGSLTEDHCEEAHYRTYTPSVPEDAPMEEDE